jgi:5-methylcytosine-specific restriction endonuclease McrBC regulatory subunit McrC
MFAYGHKYLERAAGKLMLIYPKWTKFDGKEKQFYLGNGLGLDVFPFDLKNPDISAESIIERFKST